MVTMNEIKAKYPSPTTPTGRQFDTEYCVGGALCRHAGFSGGFPTAGFLTAALQLMNEELSLSQATEFAINIIDSNDREQFDKAWDYVEQALTVGSSYG